MTSCIAIIPARGGSKRIPGKNIRHFCGKPLIAYSIEAALETAIFDRIVVSTDSEAIAEVAREYGAEVPFLRPQALADDFCGIGEAFNHTLEQLQRLGSRVDMACCIFATAPMISALDVVRGFNDVVADDRYAGALAVTTFDFPIQRALNIAEDGSLSMIQSKYQMTRSQDLEETYHDAGQFFWVKNTLPCAPNAGQKPVFIERHRVQDIDTLEDWRMAEYMFRAIEISDSNSNREFS